MQNHNREDAAKNTIEIRTSSISGKGSFAKKKILYGEYITTLTGEAVTSTPDITHICLAKGVSGDDPLQVGDTAFLILDYASKTINHSCNPNAGIKNESDLYALKNIDIHDEITYDYSTTSGTNDTWVMNCNCSSSSCRKKIGNVLTIPAATLVQYVLQDCLPEFIKQQLCAKGKAAKLLPSLCNED